MEKAISAFRSHKTFTVYILGFLFVLQSALPVYINSAFLSRFIDEGYVGLIYTISSFLAIIIFSFIPHILEKIGNYHAILIAFVVQLASYIGMALGVDYLAIPGFMASFVAIAIINLNIDIFLENYCDKQSIGKVRGIFLTVLNTAWIIAPLLGSLILTDGDYWKIYVTGIIILLPIILLTVTNLRDFKDPEYKKASIFKSFGEIRHNRDVLGVFITSLILQFFFAWMVIYTPIYLYEHIGFSWSEINIIFSIMLVPFVLIELPLGRLADTKWGEKEILSIGFIIMALSTGLISFITDHNLILWGAILFITRIGASMVEIMSETYFFKKVDTTNVNIVSLFRTMRPFAYLVGPIVASGLLTLIDIKYIFIALGIIMFYGLRYSLALNDTK